MPTYNFDLILGASEMTDDMAEALFEAGCDDGTCVSRCGVAHVGFAREADSAHTAITSAIADVRKAGQDVVRVESEGLVTEEEAREILASVPSGTA